jgi:hypothetical protein
VIEELANVVAPADKVDEIVAVPPTLIFPAIPAPPPTVKAPLVVELDVVVLGKFNAPIILALVVAELPIKVV